MKVLVTGSRYWTKADIIYNALNSLNPDIVIHGDANGADSVAGCWAREHQKVEHAYPAEWKKYGRSAGTNRNIEMLQKENLLDEPIDCVLAFPLPQSKGTYHMIRITEQAGIPVHIIGDPDYLKETDATQA